MNPVNFYVWLRSQAVKVKDKELVFLVYNQVNEWNLESRFENTSLLLQIFAVQFHRWTVDHLELGLALLSISKRADLHVGVSSARKVLYGLMRTAIKENMLYRDADELLHGLE